MVKISEPNFLLRYEVLRENSETLNISREQIIVPISPVRSIVPSGDVSNHDKFIGIAV